ncbi:MAG: tRNA (N(6)-L-threonylcarbamoyladenosine(37)-C(2))-methylthiotransferase MtaB [Clostridia bacterium]|nr:tRNA (N(6)-L-threonylcarbamoyladenosine(37)-C(2))-methylthiotransferase MtaB [Clostridia bacterium]
MTKQRSFYIYTLGCKVNRCESEAVSDLLCDSGRYFALTDDEKYRADISIINSCMVTEESEKKARKIMRRIKRENPDTMILLCGCIPQAAPEKAASMGADVICGNKNRRKILSLIDEFFEAKEKTFINGVEPHLKGDKFELLAPKIYKKLTRANLKIQDGCNRFCAYCIIPYARGDLRSLPLEEVYAQAKALVDSGHREIVLNGINLGLYGEDSGTTLAEAVKKVSEAGAERIRLGSLEVDLLTEELLRALSEIKGFCPHFHASLQSGSDNVLKRMNRRYTKAEYTEIIGNVRKIFRNASITTDIIVGFEGETEEEFAESVEFCREIGFLKIHVFPYSMREGTEAAKSKAQIPDNIKKRRAARMAEVGAELYEKYCASQVGKTLRVLFETYENGCWLGHSENFVYVKVRTDEDLKNTVRDVVIVDCQWGRGEDTVPEGRLV